MRVVWIGLMMIVGILGSAPAGMAKCVDILKHLPKPLRAQPKWKMLSQRAYPRISERPGFVELRKSLAGTFRDLRRGETIVFEMGQDSSFEVVGTMALAENGKTLKVGVSQVTRTNLPEAELGQLPQSRAFLGYVPRSPDSSFAFATVVLAVSEFANKTLEKSSRIQKVIFSAKAVLNSRVIVSLRDLGCVPSQSNEVLDQWIRQNGSAEELDRVRSEIPLFSTHWELTFR